MTVQVGSGVLKAKGVHLFTWAALANGDSGAGANPPTLPIHTVQVQGTFGAGGTVIFEGSDDGTNWFQLHNWQNTAVSFTAAGGMAIVENPLQIRPRVTAGDGTTAIVATLVSKG